MGNLQIVHGDLLIGVDRLNESTIDHTQRTEAQNLILSQFELLVPRIAQTLIEIQASMSEVHAGLTSLCCISERSLHGEMEQSRGVVTSAKDSLNASLSNAEALQKRWEEAMLQMASLADDVSQRTLTFEQSTTDLSGVATGVAALLVRVEDALNSIGSRVENLSGSTREIAAGNKSLVVAFGELQSASQKLKNLGHAITGHFNIWQEQTRNVYDSAEESTINIESAFNRIAGLVTGMEAILRNLSEVVSRSDHTFGHDLELMQKGAKDSVEIEQEALDSELVPELAHEIHRDSLIEKGI